MKCKFLCLLTVSLSLTALSLLCNTAFAQTPQVTVRTETKVIGIPQKTITVVTYPGAPPSTYYTPGAIPFNESVTVTAEHKVFLRTGVGVLLSGTVNVDWLGSLSFDTYSGDGSGESLRVSKSSGTYGNPNQAAPVNLGSNKEGEISTGQTPSDKKLEHSPNLSPYADYNWSYRIVGAAATSVTVSGTAMIGGAQGSLSLISNSVGSATAYWSKPTGSYAKQ